MNLPIAILLLASVLLIGCAHKPKSSTRIYEGEESPTIKYTARESAGGPVGGR